MGLSLVCQFGVGALRPATGERMTRAASVSRFILRFATLFSTALIKQRNYFPEKRKTEKPGHPPFPKSIFFLTRLA